MRDHRAYTPLPGEDVLFPVYSRAERLLDAALHIVGIVLALIAVPVLITLAAIWYGDASTVGAAAVYGLSLLAMLTLSASYHLARDGRMKQLLRRLDHAAIYLKIAGTYTPFAVLLAGDDAAMILAGIWGAALVGAAFKIAAPKRIERISLGLYLAMGWGFVVIGAPILEHISAASFRLMIAGGLLYTLGVGFFLWERLRFHNAIWHGLVVLASFAFYAAILVEVVRQAPTG